MPAPPPFFRALVGASVLASALALHAQSFLPANPVRLDSLAEFRVPSRNWKLAGDIAGNPRHEKSIVTVDGVALLVCNPGTEAASRGHLFTTWEHGDLQLDFEFLLTPGSNSGVYLQGRYEVQLFDSWGVRELKPGDCGGIYHRWDPARGKGNEGFDGTVHSANSRPSLELVAEGPGIAPRTLTVREPGRGPRSDPTPKVVRVEPKDRVLLQRGFVPFDPRKRLYAASVGTPAGVHFAYDFETGALLRAWRGSFINAAEMWDGRGNDQTAKPEGPALTFSGRPAIALIEYAANGDWPEQPETLWSSQGYMLEADGTPEFLSTLSELSVRDRIAPTSDGRGLTRTLQLKGKLPSWSTWILLAEASTVTPQPDGTGWVIGEREWYLDWPTGAAQQPVRRTINGKQQLAVPLTSATLEKPVMYSIVW